MKKKILCLSFIMLIFGFVGTAVATTYSFQPSPADLSDLDHYKYYTWGIDWSIPANEVITGASLFFDDIRNWDLNTNDLYVTLLDSANPGVATGTDNQGGGDYFSGQGVPLNHWHNLPYSPPQDINYTFAPSQLDSLSAYLADGNFGLGLDPDCHYYNNGIKLTVETHATPEPATMLLLGTGLVGLAGFRKKFRKS